MYSTYSTATSASAAKARPTDQSRAVAERGCEMSMIRTHTKAWESVPRAAAEDLRMSCQARGVLFWLLTRPADWQVKIGPMMRLTGITKHVWPKVRSELTEAGYLVAKKGRAVGGKIVWSFDVYSLSTNPPPALRGMVNRGLADEPSPIYRRWWNHPR